MFSPLRFDSINLLAMRLFLFAVFSCLPLCVFAEGGLPNRPYIYIAGYAEAEKPADTATFTFDVVKSEADQSKANAEVQASAAKVFALLKEHKVGANDVIAQSVASEPEIEHREADPNYRKVIGYTLGEPLKLRFEMSQLFRNSSTT
jgi:uncharacterized protein YggE